MNSIKYIPSSLLAAAVLAACSSAPELNVAPPALPQTYRELQQQPHPSELSTTSVDWKLAEPAEAQPRGEWWKAFNDAELSRLIDQANATNTTVAAAKARVRQARALAGIADAALLPAVGIGGGGQRGKAAPIPIGLPEGTAVPVSTVWQAGLTASYEVDLFGRVGANNDAAHADATASEASYRSVLLSLQADVAQTYFRLRASKAEQNLLNETLHLRQENVDINQHRFDLGDLGELDLARAKTELSTTRSEAIGVQRQTAQLEHALAVLVGQPQAKFDNVQALLDVNSLPHIPAGLPSLLLQRRPDIAAAQQTVIAANARIGVARSAMFPALMLTAGDGGMSHHLSDVLMQSNQNWLIGALLSMPLFDGGRNRNNITRNEALLEESVANYHHQVLTAFSEVEDNLVGLRVLEGQAQSIDEALVHAHRSTDLAGKLYQEGSSSYLDLLDAERNLTTIERNAVQLRANRATATVALIRAIGGDWSANR
ncbi:MAG TPA: efflux transporter outer membrane subunit [Burkholderiaceae bacterium]|jgi:multidrug efflux system outer membrane protein|nr:efflux transporter outer membrane subunit [Burkholderiaceae bacterium]